MIKKTNLVSLIKACTKYTSKKSYAGFTLIELLIASAIFVVVMVSIYSAFHSGVFGYKRIEENIDTQQAVRQILERLDLDLRNSFVYSLNNAGFKGSKNNINFFSITDTYYKDGIVQNYTSISFNLENNKLMRLSRKNMESINEESEIKTQQMPAYLEDISFSYGYLEKDETLMQWKDSWGGPGCPEKEQKELPVAVKVKVTIKNKIQENFERTIFLPLSG